MSKIYRNKLIAGTGLLAGLLTFVSPVFAHVIVTPNQVGIAATQDFTINVPNEKDTPVVGLRLLIPNGVSSVTPDTVSGWTISTKTSGTGDSATTSEIDWMGGSIPVGQRAEFVFQAQVPPSPTTLAWKAYQTYQDGTVMSWDVDPSTLKNLSDSQQDAMADKENKGAYSTTDVINDLTSTPAPVVSNNQPPQTDSMSASASSTKLALGLSGVAIVLSIVSLIFGLRKKSSTPMQ